MDPASKNTSDHVTLLLFKDGFAARTFEVPRAWLHRFGAILIMLLCVTILSAAAAIRYFQASRTGDPGRYLELEKRLTDLQTSYSELEARAKAQATAPQPAGVPNSDPNGPAAVDPITGLPTAPPPFTAIPDNASTLPPADPGTSVALASGENPLLFHALPDTIQAAPEDASQVPIAISAPKATWRGKTLSVLFNIQYVRPDKGSQQGRILILARGPELMLGYPSGLFNRVGSESLISPNRGEYFSVSRFREVAVEFGPMDSTDDLQEVEVILISQSGQLLIHQKLVPESPRKAPAPAAPAAPRAPEPVSTPAPGKVE